MISIFSKFIAATTIMGIVSHSPSHGQELKMIGTGNAFYDYYGWDVALSGDANTMAVGAPVADPGNVAVTDAGLVRLYGRNGTDWNMFQQINGTVTNGYFGSSLDLSHDSSTLIVGAWGSSAYIYDFNNFTSTYDWFYSITNVNAEEVCVSGDGSTVGVTSTWSDGAKIFVRDAHGFQQRGDTFTFYGSSYSGIALSYDGKIVAIGHVYWSSGRGRVGVFQWRDANGSMLWVQMGSDITGDAAEDYLGYYGCVSITRDGLTVSVGAFGYDRDGLSERGLVRVYNHDSTDDTWQQIGSDLVGDNAYDLFSKTALSSDGSHLTVGSYGNGGNIKTFTKNGNNYEMVGEKVTSGEGEYFGFSVDISADGAAVAIGDYGFSNNKGSAYVLVRNDFTNALPPPSGNGNGDPHFTTFSGMTFDYHGECDLVMLSSPSFASGSGLSVHIRTTRMDGKLLSYSYISGAAVGIGNNVLEVQQDGTLLVNGKRYMNNDASLPTEFATYPFTKNMIGKKKKITQYVLNLTDSNIVGGQDELEDLDTTIEPMMITIHANPKTHMLFVKIDGDNHDGIGLLGNPLAGNRLLGRDGITDMSKDWSKYGEEWQVRDTEQKLFQENRAPQYPDVCLYHVSKDGLSKKTHNLRRRLLADGKYDNGKVTREAAIAVCKDFVGVNKDNCIYDVMVMGDLEVAEDPSYGI